MSDRSTKKDIVSLDDSVLGQVMRLRPVSFRYKSAAEGTPLNYGFIAQEVEEVFPDLVLENNGLKTLASNSITALNTRAVQELATKVTALEAENAALKKELAERKARDAALEARLSALENAAPANPVKVALEK